MFDIYLKINLFYICKNVCKNEGFINYKLLYYKYDEIKYKIIVNKNSLLNKIVSNYNE